MSEHLIARRTLLFTRRGQTHVCCTCGNEPLEEWGAPLYLETGLQFQCPVQHEIDSFPSGRTLLSRQSMTSSQHIVSRPARIALWVVQGLLAALFIVAGGMKLVLPIAALTKDVPLPGAFLRFIGVLELSGGLGLVLPGLLHFRPVLTPLAALGLVIIMSGAFGVALLTGPAGTAAIPVVVGVLLAVVAVARGRALRAPQV